MELVPGTNFNSIPSVLITLPTQGRHTRRIRDGLFPQEFELRESEQDIDKTQAGV